MRSDELSSMREALRALTYSESRVMLVDDDPAIIMFLQGLLERAGYIHVVSTNDPRQAARLYGDFSPDIVVLDLQMPFLDGFGVLGELQLRIDVTEYVPILVLTGSDSPEAKRRALFRGAKDFLPKPFDPLELLLRLHNLLEARFLHLKLHQANERLAHQVSERSEQLLEAQNDTIERLAQVVEFHDDDTGQHTKRVGVCAGHIADALGLPASEVELIRRAGPLHDVGKIGIPDAILLKPGRLTPDEFEVVKMHPEIGSRILSGSSSAYLKIAAQIALGHHERWDGQGYPHGLKGEEIPLPARIVAVADFFDAVTHDRPYRPAWPREEAIHAIATESGRHFDAELVQVFLDIQASGVREGMEGDRES